MADIFEYVIQPKLDTNVDTSGAEQIAENIKNELVKHKIDISSILNTSDLNEINKFVTSIGGTFREAGNEITVSFKDALGAVETIRHTLQKVEMPSFVGELSKQNPEVGKQWEDYYASQMEIGNSSVSTTYSATEQVKSQKQEEEELVSSLKDQWDIEQKLIKAQAEKKSYAEQYYKEELAQKSQEYQNAYDAYSQKYQIGQNPQAYQNLYETSSQISAERPLFIQKVQGEVADQSNLTQSLSLVKQFQSEYSKVVQMSSKKLDSTEEFRVLIEQLGRTAQEMNDLGISANKETGQIENTGTVIKEETSAYQKLDAAIQQTNKSTQIAQAKGSDILDETKIKEATSAITSYSEAYRKKIELERSGDKSSAAYVQTNDYLNNLKGTLSEYNVEVEEGTDGSIKFSMAQNGVADASGKVQAACIANTNVQKQENDMLGEGIARFIEYRIVIQSLTSIVNSFTSSLTEMNKVMTQVQMVTMGSYEDTVKLAQQYGQLAQQLGQTTSTVAEGADVWLRQGKTAQETTQLLTASTTLATVGQLDAATATTDLTAVMNSYGIEVDSVMRIVDQLTAIDLNYAASTGQIATALQRTAATAQQTGVSLEKLEAILAVTEQNTQLSAETTGTAWQSVFSRKTLRGYMVTYTIIYFFNCGKSLRD